MGIHGGGRRREREILFQLLHPIVGRWVPLANLLQGRVKDRNGWRDGLRHRPPRIEPTIRVRFSKSFESCTDLRRRLDEALNQWFFRYRPHWPDEARWRRDGLIHELRRLLARICLGVLEPDLVILDEFQRFKPLLETRKHHQSEAARLAQELFGAKAHDGRSVRTLLLSATPYKLYTADAEIEQEDHYADFLATTRFLFGDRESHVATLQGRLSRFAGALKRTAGILHCRRCQPRVGWAGGQGRGSSTPQRPQSAKWNTRCGR